MTYNLIQNNMAEFESKTETNHLIVRITGGKERESISLYFHCFMAGNTNMPVLKLTKSRDVPSGVSVMDYHNILVKRSFNSWKWKVQVFARQRDIIVPMSTHKSGKFESNEKRKFHFIYLWFDFIMSCYSSSLSSLHNMVWLRPINLALVISSGFRLQ